MARRKGTKRAEGAPKGLSSELRDLEVQDGKDVRGGAGGEWEWNKNYRVWEANRKTFLYPENWLEP